MTKNLQAGSVSRSVILVSEFLRWGWTLRKKKKRKKENNISSKLSNSYGKYRFTFNAWWAPPKYSQLTVHYIQCLLIWRVRGERGSEGWREVADITAEHDPDGRPHTRFIYSQRHVCIPVTDNATWKCNSGTKGSETKRKSEREGGRERSACVIRRWVQCAICKIAADCYEQKEKERTYVRGKILVVFCRGIIYMHNLARALSSTRATCNRTIPTSLWEDEISVERKKKEKRKVQYCSISHFFLAASFSSLISLSLITHRLEALMEEWAFFPQEWLQGRGLQGEWGNSSRKPQSVRRVFFSASPFSPFSLTLCRYPVVEGNSRHGRMLWNRRTRGLFRDLGLTRAHNRETHWKK